MDRRAFVCTSLALAGMPGIGAAEPAGRIYRIGTLSSGPTRTDAEFRQGDWALALRDLGWAEGKNVAFVRRYADGRIDLLPALARELVAAKVDVIATFFGADYIVAKQATATIPIVIIYNGLDPVEDGLVASFARPGGNVTGVSRMLVESGAKRLDLIREALPSVRRVGVLSPSVWQGVVPGRQTKFEDRLRAAARNVHVELQFFRYGTQHDVDAAFPAMEIAGVQAFVLEPQPFTFQNRARIAERAIRHRLPGVFTLREYAEAGGLMSYGPDWTGLLKQHAGYVDRVLRGADPATLPIEQPTKFELVVNLATAAALGVSVPPSLLVRADTTVR